ncbi:FAD-dependent oxidoreductase [Rhodococcus chondri]|uniref:Uncharacterized protein n=1 Tax=Rhodococcus chondri TaxID=3065941 RepID=A0ABU7JRM2_9NOCA|nr:hypothetical protein [Rhodococcus sp. CC-R104]MEE2032675.1 hypothetical protein [Rhodococcus sp. CC-R104]
MDKIGDHAIVLGASIGGLLAARVLADFYRTVTLVERDVLPMGTEHRRGVPQGRHGHALLARGAQMMDELFPGLLDDLVAEGAPVVADGDLTAFYFVLGGHPMVRSGRFGDRRATYAPSRPLLESTIRQRLRAIPNITICDGHNVGDLTATTDRRRITGVRVGSRSGVQTLAADLVVDAMGRGGRTPALLEKLGYGRPVEEHVFVHVTYRSQLMHIAHGTLSEKLVMVGAQPGRSTGMALFGYENDTWLFTTAGMAGYDPPRDLAGMIAFVEPFTPAHVVAAIRSAEPLGAWVGNTPGRVPGVLPRVGDHGVCVTISVPTACSR